MAVAVAVVPSTFENRRRMHGAIAATGRVHARNVGNGNNIPRRMPPVAPRLAPQYQRERDPGFRGLLGDDDVSARHARHGRIRVRVREPYEQGRQFAAGAAGRMVPQRREPDQHRNDQEPDVNLMAPNLFRVRAGDLGWWDRANARENAAPRPRPQQQQRRKRGVDRQNNVDEDGNEIVVNLMAEDLRRIRAGEIVDDL